MLASALASQTAVDGVSAIPHKRMPTPVAPDTNSLYAPLVRMRLIAPGATPPLTPLPGGVSSDIYKVELAGGPICVKRALARLKVAANWRAPVARNRFEVEWMHLAGSIVPHAVPAVIAEDAEGAAFAMAWLDPALYPVWKTQLSQGRIETETAATVGRILAAIHNATARNAEIAARFASDAIFHSIRLEPYLLATADKHPDCAGALQNLADATAATRLALVHGDVSPKNILNGPKGPVLLDAECAWYGDPAFDLAFCLNHMMLKCAWHPQWTGSYMECFDALAAAYLDAVQWEPRAGIEARTARLLPGLLLARVDGKSPVEYLMDDTAHNRRSRDVVRLVARRFLTQPVSQLAGIRTEWSRQLTTLNEQHA
jgi:aminoglycoside phosphotransferase (APT) family kinase protein